MKQEKGIENAEKGFRNEMLKIMILNHLSWQPGYPYGLMKALEERKIAFLKGLTKNDLYNAIASLEKQSFIRSKVVKKGMKIQKYYVLTSKGKKVAKFTKKMMIKSFGEVQKFMEERL